MNIQVKKEHYFRKKYDDLGRFISYFYQVDLSQDVIPSGAKVLEIGKGNGFYLDYMKKLGYQVTTCDFDKDLNPDVVADIRKLPFPDDSFDLVTAFEVLEHLPFADLELALGELKRVSRGRVIISLPYRSTYFEMVLKFPFIRKIFRRAFLDFFLRIPLVFGGIKVSGQHYWEIDLWKTSLGRVRRVIKRFFGIEKELSPIMNHYHRFFVLKK
ncbi:MAG: methyltransferase domain-containing protein [bacterium]|nr:methyltransferase domain-containing protein [bacterium]